MIIGVPLDSDLEAFLMLTVLVIIAIAAFVLTIMSAVGKVPLWVAVMVISVLGLLLAGIPLTR